MGSSVAPDLGARGSAAPRRHCALRRVGVHVPAGDGKATRLATRAALVPIMRAGLGMVDAMRKGE